METIWSWLGVASNRYTFFILKRLCLVAKAYVGRDVDSKYIVMGKPYLGVMHASVAGSQEFI
jgi:hypothetical protein